MACRDARNRAKKKSVPFELTIDDIFNITPDECPVFGTSFAFVGNGHAQPESATLDRIKSELGYVKGNIVVISAKANRIKNEYRPKDLYIVADFFWELEKPLNGN